jgi:hypothetical protein
MGDDQLKSQQTICVSCVPFFPASLLVFSTPQDDRNSKMVKKPEANVNTVIHALIVNLDKYIQ